MTDDGYLIMKNVKLRTNVWIEGCGKIKVEVEAVDVGESGVV